MGQMRPATANPISASGMAAVGPGRLGGIMVTPGSDATTVQIYDSEDSTLTNDVTMFGPAKFVANAKTEYFPYVPGLGYTKGLYIAIIGTGISIIPYTY